MDVLLQQLLNGVVLGSTYSLVALGLTLVFGVLLIPNFAHGEFYMLGALFTYQLTSIDVSFWLAVPAAIVIVIAIGILLDLLVFRPLDRDSGLTLMIAALASAIILQQVAALGWGHEPRTTEPPFSGILQLGWVTIGYYQILLIFFMLCCWVGLTVLLKRTRTGLAIRAVAENRDAAQLMGINLLHVRIVTFTIGAALGAAAGGLLSANFPVYPEMGTNPVLKAFVILVLGGIGNIWGAIFGGLFLGATEVLIAGYIRSDFQDIGAFLILVLVLLIRPSGLFGAKEIER